MGEFESQASKLFLHLYQQFEQVSSNLDRQTDENVFQQSSSRYTLALQQQLNQIALRLIEEHKHTIKSIDDLQHALVNRIDALVNEFKQKTKL